jgi:phage tail protein X
LTTYRTIDGDMIDAIAKAELGSESHAVEVLAANPGLADLGPVYAAGLTITLPVVAAPVMTGQIRLWGRT